MTTANKITIVRLLLIPVFVLLGVSYGDSVNDHAPQESLRLGAILVFVTAAVSDGIDGYIARHYNQRTKLGAILDPIADKGLLLAGLLTLTFTNWGYRIPHWFTILVIARDMVIVAGSLGLHYVNGEVHVHPRWSGKIATVFQMIVVVWMMLQLHFVNPLWPVALAGVFTLVSWVGYMADGFRQLKHSEHGQPVNPVPAPPQPVAGASAFSSASSPPAAHIARPISSLQPATRHSPPASSLEPLEERRS